MTITAVLAAGVLQGYVWVFSKVLPAVGFQLEMDIFGYYGPLWSSEDGSYVVTVSHQDQSILALIKEATALVFVSLIGYPLVFFVTYQLGGADDPAEFTASNAAPKIPRVVHNETSDIELVDIASHRVDRVIVYSGVSVQNGRAVDF